MCTRHLLRKQIRIGGTMPFQGNKATKFQTFAVFCMLYDFFWVSPRHQNFICWRFGTLCLFHLHRRIGVEWLCLRNVGVFIGSQAFFPYKYPPFFFLWRCDPTRVMMASSFTRFLNHTQGPTTVGRTPLDEWSARRRDLYLKTHNTHNRQTSMPSVGFEPTISAGERPPLDRAATGTGKFV